jgi:RNA polymerase sigma-70 factor (ECF subfamily)
MMYKEEFPEIFLTYQRFLYRKALGYMKNQMDAEDAMQETFIRAWHYCEGLKSDVSFAPWLIRILVNECNNILRKKKQTPEVYIGDAILCMHAASNDIYLTDMDFHEALSALDTRYRIPIQLTLLYGLSTEETASRLHMTRSALSGMVRRGKEKMRTAMLP